MLYLPLRPRRWELRLQGYPCLAPPPKSRLIRLVAIMFSYFESLISSAQADLTRLQKERQRVNDMTEMLHRSEYAPIAWEEWVEATMDLFDTIISALPDENALSALEQAFTDEGLAPALVQHFRVRHAPLAVSGRTPC